MASECEAFSVHQLWLLLLNSCWISKSIVTIPTYICSYSEAFVGHKLNSPHFCAIKHTNLYYTKNQVLQGATGARLFFQLAVLLDYVEYMELAIPQKTFIQNYKHAVEISLAT